MHLQGEYKNEDDFHFYTISFQFCMGTICLVTYIWTSNDFSVFYFVN